jgi:hypothetical protein
MSAPLGSRSRSTYRTFGGVAFLVVLMAAPASAQTLALCVKATNKKAAALYTEAKNACQLQYSANTDKLGTSARKAANQTCLRKAKATNTRSVAAGQATCKRNNPVISPSAAKNTQTFCLLTKAWLAAEEAGLINPNIDIDWVHSTTDPLLAMYKIAPASIRADVGFIAKSVYSSRIGVIVVEAAQNDSEVEYARSMGQLIGDVELGIASQGFAPAITRLSEFTKVNCGVDLEGALKALQEKYI